ncbi:SPW repeat domain-containing protein [Salinarimonas rosea]|uniref:SPW repeat domain-containing protein n=1 Tax=Salinarimonas rosea TaxID=552063 RepID=UPI0003F97547|nr:SPW repeat protein [Salinarimonas rosea]
MRFIPTNVHAIVDYLVGVLLIASPWLFGFAIGGVAQWLPVILGAGVILYSLFTDYEYAARRAISMPTHLWLDALGGALLAVSPWLFGFADFVFWPHLIIGLFEIGAAVTTKTVPTRATDADDRARVR